MECLYIKKLEMMPGILGQEWHAHSQKQDIFSKN